MEADDLLCRSDSVNWLLCLNLRLMVDRRLLLARLPGLPVLSLGHPSSVCLTEGDCRDSNTALPSPGQHRKISVVVSRPRCT